MFLVFHIAPKIYFRNFTSYFAAGAGVAYNHLSNIKERNETMGLLISEVASKTHSNFAARIGLGFRRDFLENFCFDCALFANYIGKITSGNFRTNVPSGRLEEIGRYAFHTNYIGSLTCSIKYFY